MEKNNDGTGAIIALAGGVIIIVLLLITFFSSIRYVGTGEVGVVTNYGKVTGRELSEGMSWVAPWGVNSVTKYDIKTQKEEAKSAAATRDLQDVNGTIVLNYKLQRNRVSEIHKTIGQNYKDVVITPAIQEVFKAATAKYNETQLMTHSAEVKKDVTVELEQRLKKRGIIVQEVNITNFSFSQAFNNAIESVQIANQQVAQAKQELEKAKIDAEKAITAAKGQAQAQRLQQQTLTKELIQKMAIEKWNGVLPTTAAGGNTIFSIPIK